MNTNTIKALGRDALYQVLDNSVFRILVLLTAVPILLTFLVGFREDEIVFLFGVERWSYEGIVRFLAGAIGANPATIADAQGTTIEALLGLVFDWGMGGFGVMFCIAATAFFVPAMIEKGAADVLFHKPISRLTFYIARYFSGLLFIGIISLVLVGGMQLGLLLVSGYNDPGIIFGAFQLTYVFGLLYTTCMLIGVVTRSTVASILLTVLFFMFNGCVHQTWALLEQGEATKKESAPKEELDDEELEKAVAPPHIVERAFRTGVNILHYSLPKTGDASVIASKLRKSIDPPLYIDRPSQLALFHAPGGWVRAPEATFDSPPLLPLEAHALGEPQLVLTHSDSKARFSLWRRMAVVETVKVNTRTSQRTERASRTASNIEDELEERPGISELDRDSLRFGESSKGKPVFGAARLHWSEEGSGWRLMVLCKLDNQYFFTALLEAPDAVTGENLFKGLNDSIALDKGTDATWYSKQLSLDAPLKFNLIFSVGSSVAFALLMLALGWWRLTRIEF